MTGLTVLRYLIGNAAAIRLLAVHPCTIPLGLLLVVSAGLARNYDQMLLMNSPKWFLVPLVVSSVSALWFSLFLLPDWREVRIEGREAPVSSVWKGMAFFGLFWMTAPVAWLYAIPVERFCGEADAARWNVALLAVVALWRVVLMARVHAVITGYSFWRGLGCVLLPASIEAGIIAFVGVLGSVVLRGMAGLRNSPAEEVLARTMDGILPVLLIAFILGAALYAKPGSSNVPPEPLARAASRRFPLFFIATVAAVSFAISLVPQREWRLTMQAVELSRNSDWKGLAAFLSQHDRQDFAPAAVLPPSPWEYASAVSIPSMFAALGPDTAPWVREMTVQSLDTVLSQGAGYRIFPQAQLEVLRQAMREQSEGAELLRRYPDIPGSADGPLSDAWGNGIPGDSPQRPQP